jgi:hypothetical protein
MMGLEPTTFCMAKAGGRSHSFASVRRNLLFAAASGRASERRRTERTAAAAIAAIVIRGTFSGDAHHVSPRVAGATGKHRCACAAESRSSFTRRTRKPASGASPAGRARRPVAPEVAGSSPVAPVSLYRCKVGDFVAQASYVQRCGRSRPLAALLTSASRIDAGEGEEVLHPEGRAGRGERRRPPRLLHKVGARVALDQPDQHLGDDPPADRPEREPVGNNLCLLENVVPKRRARLEPYGCSSARSPSASGVTPIARATLCPDGRLHVS